jgi:polyisoprenoid-binding protein YceI
VDGAAAAVVALVGGPFLYIHLVAGYAPAPLGLGSASPTSAADAPTSGPSAATDGTWTVTKGSVVGYRVKEVLFGQSHTAVGRTSSVSGSLGVRGPAIRTGKFTVQMSTVTSDESRRDDQFNGRIMDTAAYPTATFVLSKPIRFGSIPSVGASRTLGATGELTMHGTTRTVTLDVTGRYTGNQLQVTGSIPITFSDWNIGNPSFGGVVTTEDHGTLEFLLVLSPS